MAVMALTGCSDDPARTEPAREVTPSSAPNGPPGTPDLVSTQEVGDEELMGYARVLQQFVTAAREGDCDQAWAMGNQNLHQAYGPKDVFCSKTLPAVAYIDLDLGRLEAEQNEYVWLMLPHSQSVGMITSRDGRREVSATNLGTYEREVAE